MHPRDDGRGARRQKTCIEIQDEPRVENAPVYQSHWAGNGQASDRSLQHQVVLRVFDQFLADRVRPLPHVKITEQRFDTR